MLEVTALATEKLKQYLSERNLTGPLRVTTMRGCGGSISLGLALDAQKPGDTTVELDGLLVVMDTKLLDECGRTKVDYKPPSGCGCGSGSFVVTPEIPLPGSGRGGSCSTGSCRC